MELNYKKISLIAGFLLLCVLIGYAIYYLFFKPAAVSPPVATDTTQGTRQLPSAQTGSGGGQAIGAGGQLPTGQGATGETTKSPIATAPNETAMGGITKVSTLSDSQSFAATLSSDGNNLYFYDQTDNKFYRLDKNGQKTALSAKNFYDVQKVTWAPNKEKAVIEYPDGAKIVYNFQTQQQYTLPKHWEDFDFSPQSDQLVAKSIGLDTENRWLVIANDDGSQARAIEEIGKNAAAVYPSWSPNNLSIALYAESLDFNRQTIYFIGQNKENFKSMVVEGRSPEFAWTPSGDKLIYSVYSDNTNLNPNLWIVNAKGDAIGANRQQLNLQTWASKCTVASEEIAYCAVPVSLPEGSGLFPELASESADNIYQVNLTTGSHSLIAVPDESYNIQNINVSADGANLYFTNGASGEIYKIKLK
ncbi:MAG: hypothetical protein M0Q92_00530 [Methanoregula sp.]|jgi:hypothetical protein|nr:hypothetical protein [Methanoregula sp.]